MIDFFDIDEEYMINKQLHVKDFLYQSNLKTKEREYIKNAISAIVIMYDLPDNKGNELIILNVALKNIIKDDLEIAYIATVVARSIPHSVVVVLSIGDNATIYAFNSHQNKLDSSRNVVENRASSFWFTASNPEHYMKNIMNVFQNIEVPLVSVDETVSEWLSLIRESREIRSEFEYKLSIKRERETQRRHCLLNENDLPTLEEVFAEELDSYDIYYQKNFIHTLAEYSVIFYNEYYSSCEWLIQDEFDEYLINNEKEEWIDRYLNVCQSIVETELYREILDIEIKTILETFYNNETIELDGTEVIDENYLQDAFSDLRSFL